MKEIGLLSLLCFALLGVAWAVEIEDTDFRMDGVLPDRHDLYLCKAVALDTENEHYLVGFSPHASMSKAHHMLMFGCATAPGSEADAWDCGEMQSSGESNWQKSSVCAEGDQQQIVYAWGRNAPELNLPKGVGFKVGKNSPVKYLVLQVHYKHGLQEPDYSGVTIHSTEEKMPKRAGVLLMVTGGRIEPGTTEDFETACRNDENVQLHPFAFRVHAHKHGKVVSGWHVTEGQKEHMDWELIGKQDPMVEQMFYPVKNRNIVIKPGDVMASRCHMKSKPDEKTVYVGSTGADEMCNFYMYYYVNGDQILEDNTCYSPGPPYYYWGKQGGLTDIPEKEANEL